MAAEPLQIADSTHVKSASYDSDTSELVVVFPNSSTYAYDSVPKEVADSFAAAPSAGKFLASEIKGVYPFRKL